jgi:hypothetical protein
MSVGDAAVSGECFEVVDDARAVRVGRPFPSVDLTRKNSAGINLEAFSAKGVLR